MGDNMSNEMIVRPSNNDVALIRSSIPSEHEMMVYHTMAEQAVSSKMYKGIGEKAGVMMIMLAARELGIGPMQALNGGLNIIQGKVELSARMMSALIRKAGHHISVKESTDAGCILVGKRADTGESITCSYYFIEAQKAGLVKPGGGWIKCPKDMCFARALSRLARQLFSDVIGIGYIEGEIRASEASNEEHQPLDEVITITEEEIDDYLSIFHLSEREMSLEYLKVVQTHFEWTEAKAIHELLKDKDRLIQKFKKWKEGKAKTIEVKGE